MKAPGFEWGREEFRRQLKKSSFAPGAIFLDPAARRDLEVFYAFCRAVDDSADDFGPGQGRKYLAQWKRMLATRPKAAAPQLVSELWRVCESRKIPLTLLRELIAGAESDLRKHVVFKTRADLLRYCHRVAGVVGQACLPIFGVDLKAGADYAEALGRAFQIINIIRDAAEDSRRGRDYIAREDLKRFGGRQAAIARYAALAKSELARADALGLRLPADGLRPSLLMRALYGALLDLMVADGLKVFEKRYRLSAPRKAWVILKSLAT